MTAGRRFGPLMRCVDPVDRKRGQGIGRRRASSIVATLALLAAGPALAQATIDNGLPPASGLQNPVLPPASGSQYPNLPPPSGSRYVPGTGGPFGDQPRRVPGGGAPRSFGGSGLTGSVAAEAPQPPPPGEVDSIAGISTALRSCWTPPVMAGPNAGAMATARFALRRDGSLLGPPRITWQTRRGDPALQSRFTASVEAAFATCAPLRLSRRLGEAIAGRPFTIRFHGHAPTREGTT